MDILQIIIIAIALSIDALSVSMAIGCIIEKLRFKHALLISCSFGFFQGVMPLIGWLAGSQFAEQIERYDHWVAFVLLCGVSLNMFYEAYKNSDAASKSCLNPRILLIMSIATSIDALAIGFTFSMLQVTIILPVLIIAAVTFFNCLAGIYIAHKIGALFGKRIEYVAATVLMILAVKILVEHLTA